MLTAEIYHIFNRGTDRRKIFLGPSYYSRFITTLDHCLKYNYPYSLLKRQLQKAETPQERDNVLSELENKRIEPIVDIISFCLMPNHYHLTLKQLVDNGITNFIHRICTSYAGYFNIRQNRSGRLFEGPFKAVEIESENQLIHLTRYHHLNPKKIGLNTEALIAYPWSSFSTYLGRNKFSFVNTGTALASFSRPKEYLNFVLAEIDEFEPCRLDHIAIDDDFGWFSEFRNLEKAHQEEIKERYLENLS